MAEPLLPVQIAFSIPSLYPPETVSKLSKTLLCKVSEINELKEFL
jgi:hypothetical protein